MPLKLEKFTRTDRVEVLPKVRVAEGTNGYIFVRDHALVVEAVWLHWDEEHARVSFVHDQNLVVAWNPEAAGELLLVGAWDQTSEISSELGLGVCLGVWWENKAEYTTC